MEIFEIVDENDRVIGLAPRAECHGNPALIHRTSHVVITDGKGGLLLQKRSPRKDVQPGKWDTAVGGHLNPGEEYETAARREMAEELGLPPDTPIRELFDLKIRNPVESENTRVFQTVHAGPFTPDPEEIDTVRFWTRTEIDASIGTGVFTPNLEREIAILRGREII